MPSQVLCFGHDEMLLMTRKWLLEEHVRVQLASDISIVSKLAGQQFFDVVILCHTIDPKERQLAIHLLRESTKETKVLCLTSISDSSNHLSSGEGYVVAGGMAEALLRSVLPLLGDRGTTSLDRQ